MASVFLSYDRDDTDRARHFARALEKAGHEVWWDLHVRGGAQFSKVIEEALKAADVVVVLWSKNSIESAWVRDEAAAGRDSGRLVPVTIDGTEPPLGFRQFQTNDLSGWRGRGRPAELRGLLADIAAVAAPQSATAEPPPPPRKFAPRFGPHTRWRYLLALTAALIVLVAGGLYWVLAGKGARSTTVAVAAADSATTPVARDLLINLGSLPSVQRGTVQLLAAADRKSSDLIFEASSTGAGKTGINLALMSGRDRTILWSKEFDQGPGNAADLKLQLAHTAGRVLGCAVEGLNPGQKPLRPQTLKLYLTGCSQFAEAGNDEMPSVVSIFEQVVRDAPRFRPAWAKLLLAEISSPFHPEAAEKLEERLRRHIKQALALDPRMPEATLAKAILLPPSAFGENLRLLDEAKENSPTNVAVLIGRAGALMRVGRMVDAINDAEQAARLDPTSPDALSSYVLTLAYSGRIDAARAELQRAERMWGDTEKLRDLQYAFDLRFGDPKAMLDTQAYRESSPGWQMYMRTRADPTAANIDRLIAFMLDLYARRGLTVADIVGHAQAYGELHREDVLYDVISRLPADQDLSPLSEVVFRPSLQKFREDPRFMTVARRMGLVDYWMKSGKWPNFCFDPGQPYDCRKEAAKLTS